MDPTENFNDYIYLDNNATTKMHHECIKIMNKWNMFPNNSSASSALGKQANNAISLAHDYILDYVFGNSKEKKDYFVIFTGSATESNCMLLRSTVEAYHRILKEMQGSNEIDCEIENSECNRHSVEANNPQTFESNRFQNTGAELVQLPGVVQLPHIITSSIEHKSILDCCKDLEESGYAEVTYVNPNAYGCINSNVIESHIKKNTCLISIMHANNEIGSINNIDKISEIAIKHNIPFHTDAVQTFGKLFNHDQKIIKEPYPAAITACFHKFNGPVGLGLLILNKNFVEGYELKAIINGSQQHGLRGGTENVAGIVGGVTALMKVTENRDEKNNKMKELILHLYKEIKKRLSDYPKISICKYADYMTNKLDDEIKPNAKIIFLGVDFENDKIDRFEKTLPNTVLISFIPSDRTLATGKTFCNIKLKNLLEKNAKVITSIGSACNTSSKSASHVLSAIKATPDIKRGTIRISVGDNNTKKEIETFVEYYLKLVNGVACLS
jgi:cysteine desulfurase